jgi:YVTN family beta-propeller protein
MRHVAAAALVLIPLHAGAATLAVLDKTPDGRHIWTSNREADTVSVVDAASLAEVAEIEVGDFPIRVDVTPDGARALVTNAQGGDLSVLDTPFPEGESPRPEAGRHDGGVHERYAGGARGARAARRVVGRQADGGRRSARRRRQIRGCSRTDMDDPG